MVVGILSNFLGKASVPPNSNGPLRCRSAEGQEVDAGLKMILGSPAQPAVDEQVDLFVRVMADRGFDARRVWIAERDGQLRWAVLPIISPGRTALLLAPQSGVAAVRDDAAELVKAVTQRLQDDGARLVQWLVEPADAAAAEIAYRCSFQLTADLLYLHARISQKTPPPPSTWRATPYTAELHPLFANTILESYQGSLDCPSLNGLRDIEDIVAGHKAVGRFDPNWWFLLSPPDDCATPLGVLLLGPQAGADGAELVYMGLAPAARGRGLGDWALRLAAHKLATARIDQLTLAVDAANEPALKLYYRHGFQRVGDKLAFMKFPSAGS